MAINWENAPQIKRKIILQWMSVCEWHWDDNAIFPLQKWLVPHIHTPDTGPLGTHGNRTKRNWKFPFDRIVWIKWIDGECIALLHRIGTPTNGERVTLIPFEPAHWFSQIAVDVMQFTRPFRLPNAPSVAGYTCRHIRNGPARAACHLNFFLPFVNLPDGDERDGAMQSNRK